jgi:hypothetical protein
MGLAIVLAIVGGLYWAVLMGPLQLDNLDVREHVTSAFNESARVPVENLTVQLLAKLNNPKFANHYEVDENGVKAKVGGLGLTEEDITIVRNEETSSSQVRVVYTREVHMVPFGKWRKVRFVVEKSGPWNQ